MMIELIDECLARIGGRHSVPQAEVLDMLLDLRLACSSTLERTNEGEDELQEELVALVGADPGSGEPAASPAHSQE